MWAELMLALGKSSELKVLRLCFECFCRILGLFLGRAQRFGGGGRRETGIENGIVGVKRAGACDDREPDLPRAAWR